MEHLRSQKLKRVHVDEERRVGDLFGVGVGEDAGEEFGEGGFSTGFEKKLKAVFGFEAGERGAGGAEDANFVGGVLCEKLRQLVGPLDGSVEIAIADDDVG